MRAVLYMSGILVFIATIIVSTAALGIFGLIIGLLGGVVIASLFFGLAEALDKLDDIKSRLSSQDEKVKKSLSKTVKCTRCQHEYDDSYSGCPNCAFKPGREYK